LNGELEWRAHCKPLNETVSTQQYLYDVIRVIFVRSATWHSLRARTGSVPVLKPDLSLANSCRLPKESLSLELISLIVLTIVAQSLFTLREIIQMEREMYYIHLRAKGLVRRVLKPPDRTAIRRSSNRVIVRGSLRLPMSFAVSVQFSRSAIKADLTPVNM